MPPGVARWRDSEVQVRSAAVELLVRLELADMAESLELIADTLGCGDTLLHYAEVSYAWNLRRNFM